MARILLVRHGQSEWNAVGRWQGHADVALTDLGRAEAAAAASRLGLFDLVVASPLLRAAETAHIIATELGIGPIVSMPDLAERNVGEWSGLTTAEIEREWPDHLANGRRPPSFESDEDFHERVDRALHRVAVELADPSAEALAVAHGGLIYALEGRADRRRGRIPNLGALWVEVVGGQLRVGDRVELIDHDDVHAGYAERL